MIMAKIRYPAVAGQFYPGEAEQLKRSVEGYLANSVEAAGKPPKAIIAPHAGYIYSGPIAGTAYSYLAQANGNVKRVVLIGPSHRAATRGLAASAAQAFATPLGRIPLDRDSAQLMEPLKQVSVFEDAHTREHCLEVQLPFLQTLFSDIEIVPLVVGDASPTEVAEVLDKLWGGRETVVVVSSDLSHYHDYATATRLDKETSKGIEGFQMISEGQACGRRAINGLLHLAKQRQMRVRTVDLRNSGDTAGPRDRVVGYGAYVFWE
jgi:AmmeMemoRadiSam system protein B